MFDVFADWFCDPQVFEWLFLFLVVVVPVLLVTWSFHAREFVLPAVLIFAVVVLYLTAPISPSACHGDPSRGSEDISLPVFPASAPRHA